jgi:hypothetical protein
VKVNTLDDWPRPLAGVFILALVSASACGSKELTRDEAKNVIQQRSLIRPTDNVSVDAISSTSPTEALVRASLAGTTTNLKFRCFDTGWTSEFVETKTGGWLAPDVAIGQIREDNRKAAAAKWAQEHKELYAKTAKQMYYISVYHVPNPKEVALPNYREYQEKQLRLFASLFKDKSDTDSQLRFSVIQSKELRDAWEAPIRFDYNSKDGSTLVVSSGADKKAGTDDDLVCLNTFRRGYEDGREVFFHDRTWRIPEHMDSIVGDFFDTDGDKLEY